MQFYSDNAAIVHPKVMEAIANANAVDLPYDEDALSQQMQAQFSDLFGTKVHSLWLSSGTVANAIALSAICAPYQGILCHEKAHIEEDECGAPGFYTHGAKLLLVPGENGKLTPAALEQRIAHIRKDVHQVQPAVLSITNATEAGSVYTIEEVEALGDFCKKHALGFHMDGARLANACAALDLSADDLADITWRAGVNMLSFGFVKNGGMNAEALICFDSCHANACNRMRKRGGHLQSKGRFLAAQILAMLQDNLWLENGRAANMAAANIAEAAASRLARPVEANEIFVHVTADEAANLREQGFGFYDWGAFPQEGFGLVRFVTSWNHDDAAIAPLLAALAALPAIGGDAESEANIMDINA